MLTQRITNALEQLLIFDVLEFHGDFFLVITVEGCCVSKKREGGGVFHDFWDVPKWRKGSDLRNHFLVVPERPSYPFIR